MQTSHTTRQTLAEMPARFDSRAYFSALDKFTCVMPPADRHQRCEPGAPDVQAVTEVSDWLASAGCSGSARATRLGRSSGMPPSLSPLWVIHPLPLLIAVSYERLVRRFVPVSHGVDHGLATRHGRAEHQYLKHEQQPLANSHSSLNAECDCSVARRQRRNQRKQTRVGASTAPAGFDETSACCPITVGLIPRTLNRNAVIKADRELVQVRP